MDEARHAAFFDRFGAEVMALDAEDLRGRMQEVSQRLTAAWSTVFDDGLRDVAKRIQAKPDDLDLFVEGITTYHLVIEGLLAITGQKFIRDYLIEHDLYPGFCEGFGLVERDEHRHIAFGVRFLKDAIDAGPAATAAPSSARCSSWRRAPATCSCPPYAEDAREFTSYGYHSSEIYGYAYRTLKRRMGVLGLQVPPAEELMPGPVAEADALPAAPVEQPAGFSQNGEGRQSNGQQHEAQATRPAAPRARCRLAAAAPPPAEPRRGAGSGSAGSSGGRRRELRQVLKRLLLLRAQRDRGRRPAAAARRGSLGMPASGAGIADGLGLRRRRGRRDGGRRDRRGRRSRRPPPASAGGAVGAAPRAPSAAGGTDVPPRLGGVGRRSICARRRGARGQGQDGEGCELTPHPAPDCIRERVPPSRRAYTGRRLAPSAPPTDRWPGARSPSGSPLRSCATA